MNAVGFTARCAGFFVALACWLAASRASAEPAGRGVVVVVQGAATPGLVWPLAQAIYASAALRPPGIDEPKARALVGQGGPSELAELRDGVHDEGAVSRRVLAAIAANTRAAAVAVVRGSEAPNHVQVRLFVVDHFDVALYDGDPTDPGWRGEVVRALEVRQTASPPGRDEHGAPAQNGTPKRSEPSGPRPFYRSPWFWGGLAAAAVLGGAVLIVSQVTKHDDVRIHVQPPSASAVTALRF